MAESHAVFLRPLPHKQNGTPDKKLILELISALKHRRLKTAIHCLRLVRYEQHAI